MQSVSSKLVIQLFASLFTVPVDCCILKFVWNAQRMMTDSLAAFERLKYSLRTQSAHHTHIQTARSHKSPRKSYSAIFSTRSSLSNFEKLPSSLIMAPLSTILIDVTNTLTSTSILKTNHVSPRDSRQRQQRCVTFAAGEEIHEIPHYEQRNCLLMKVRPCTIR
jgi:hypothetical protein